LSFYNFLKRSVIKMTKRLLTEGTINRFMELAGNNKYARTFLKEEEEKDKKDSESKDEQAPPADDAAPAPEAGAPEAGADPMAGGAPDPMAGDMGGAPDPMAGAMAGGAPDPMAGGAPGGMPPEEEQPALAENVHVFTNREIDGMTKEILKRVTKRLVRESLRK
jgi:hypothetical protein